MNDLLRSRALLRALYVAVPLLLVVSLGGLATVDTSDDKPSVAASASSDATTTTLANGGAGPVPGQPGAPGAATTAAPSGKSGPATTQRPAAPAPTLAGGAPAPVQPGPTKPPVDGRYRYRFEGSQPGSQQQSDGPREVDIAVKTTGRSGAEVRQTATIKSDEVTVTTRWVWGPSAWIEEGSAFETQGMSFDCTWKPPVVKVKLEVTQASKWDLDSTCTINTPQGTVQIHRVEHAEVTGVERTAVAGESVDVWVIARRGTITTKVSGGAIGERTSSGTFTGKELFASARGLTVRAKGTSKSSDGSEQTFSQELLSLKPA